jgi:hypothetical protein
MPARKKIALVAVLVAASASTALAGNGKHGAGNGARAALSDGGSGATLAPFTQFEHEWFARASRPNNH